MQIFGDCKERKDMKATVLCYKKCSTCQKALKWLEENKIDYIQRPIKEENPTLQELKEWQRKSGLPLKRFFNTSGSLYRELNLKERLPSMPEEEQLKLLAGDGMLVKRPLLVTQERVYPGFKESDWKSILL